MAPDLSLHDCYYRWFVFRFVFITVTPRQYAKCDKHKILKLNRWYVRLIVWTLFRHPGIPKVPTFWVFSLSFWVFSWVFEFFLEFIGFYMISVTIISKWKHAKLPMYHQNKSKLPVLVMTSRLSLRFYVMLNDEWTFLRFYDSTLCYNNLVAKPHDYRELKL